MRGGTLDRGGFGRVSCISIHPPHAGWDGVRAHGVPGDLISIHPPHAGWDVSAISAVLPMVNFNPPTPCGVGPGKNSTLKVTDPFQSTHPMRGGT